MWNALFFDKSFSSNEKKCGTPLSAKRSFSLVLAKLVLKLADIGNFPSSCGNC